MERPVNGCLNSYCIQQESLLEKFLLLPGTINNCNAESALLAVITGFTIRVEIPAAAYLPAMEVPRR